MSRTHKAVVRKLEPIRTSGRFRAILGYLLGQKWTEPQIIDAAIIDGSLLVCHEGDCGLNDFIGPGLRGNLEGIARYAKLSPAQTRYLIGLGESLCR